VADEGGFDFHTPPRREAKQFEPPPWEQDAFDELERKKAEQAAAVQAIADMQREKQDEAERLAAQEAVRQAGPADDEAQSATAGKDQGPEAGGRQATELDDRKVAAMLAELSAEEPSAMKGLWKTAMAAAILLAAIGVVLIVWALAAFVGIRRTGAVGAGSGAVLLFFGAGFVGGAWWLTVRTLRDRGVL
jgi:hypothetical protein